MQCLRTYIIALTVLFATWNLWARSATDADFDGSGKVDFTDFVEFA